MIHVCSLAALPDTVKAVGASHVSPLWPMSPRCSGRTRCCRPII